MAQDLFRTPQYIALCNKHDAIRDALETSGSITRVAERLKAKGLIDGDAETRNANQLLQTVTCKIGYSWESFYDLVDALNECELPTAIGQTLEKECGACVWNICVPDFTVLIDPLPHPQRH